MLKDYEDCLEQITNNHKHLIESIDSKKKLKNYMKYHIILFI